MRRNLNSILAQLKTQGVTLGALVALAWIIQGINGLTNGYLVRFGIITRDLDGLWGILFAPFIHGGFGHLMANTPPFLILGWVVMLYGQKDFWITSVIAAVVGGLGAWAFSSPLSVSVGASGVIFGYLGCLLLRGWFERSLVSILVSVGVGAVYGGLVFGVLPSQPGISWQSHLFGFIGGILAAWLLAQRKSAAKESLRSRS